jgi:bifunctional non-homologous end joining protein LigD
VPYPRPKPPAGGIKATCPGFKVPTGERWVHEIKFDGYRVQVHLRDAAVKVYTRRGNDWTNRFRKIAADAWHINAGSAIIDGEVVVPAVDGTTDFSVLQNELKGRFKKIVMVAFDLLYLNGYDLRKVPLFERKALLNKIIAETDIQFSEGFEVDGAEMCRASSRPIRIKTTSAAHRGLLSQSCVAVPEGVPSTARILRASSILR